MVEIRGVAGPLEVGDHGGQSRPGQAAALDRQGERGVILLPAAGAPSRMTAMLVDLQGHGGDVDLLDDDGLVGVGQQQVAAAAGAGVQEVVGRRRRRASRAGTGRAGARCVPAGRRACAGSVREAVAACFGVALFDSPRSDRRAVLLGM